MLTTVVRSSRRAALTFAAGVLLPMLAGCVDLTGLRDLGRVGDFGHLEAVEVGQGAVVELGDTTRLAATGRVGGVAGLLGYDPLADARWSVDDRVTLALETAAVGTALDSVYPRAQVLARGLRLGTAVVTATARGLSGTSVVRVIPRVVRLSAVADRDTIAVGDVAYLVVGALAEDGTHPAELPYVVVQSDSAVATAYAQPRDMVSVGGRAPGTSTVTVRFRHAAPVSHRFVVIAKP